MHNSLTLLVSHHWVKASVQTSKTPNTSCPFYLFNHRCSQLTGGSTLISLTIWTLSIMVELKKPLPHSNHKLPLLSSTGNLRKVRLPHPHMEYSHILQIITSINSLSYKLQRKLETLRQWQILNFNIQCWRTHLTCPIITWRAIQALTLQGILINQVRAQALGDQQFSSSQWTLARACKSNSSKWWCICNSNRMTKPPLHAFKIARSLKQRAFFLTSKSPTHTTSIPRFLLSSLLTGKVALQDPSHQWPLEIRSAVAAHNSLHLKVQILSAIIEHKVWSIRLTSLSSIIMMRVTTWFSRSSTRSRATIQWAPSLKSPHLLPLLLITKSRNHQS